MGKFAFDPDLASDAASSLVANGFSSDFSKPSDDSGGGGADAFLTAVLAISGLLYIYQPPDSVGSLSSGDDSMVDRQETGTTGTVGTSAADASIVNSGFSTDSLSRALVRDAGAAANGTNPAPAFGVSVGLSGPTEGTWVLVLQGDVDFAGTRNVLTFDNSAPSTDANRRVLLSTSGANITAQYRASTPASTMTTADFKASGAVLIITRDATSSELGCCLVAAGGTVSVTTATVGTLNWDGGVIMVGNAGITPASFAEFGVAAAVVYDNVLSTADLQTIVDAVA